MKKILTISLIFSLIVITSLIKNSTKKIDEELFSLKENILNLNLELDNMKLEFDYLSSPEKLTSYQNLYFENKFIQKSINEIKIIEKSKKVKNKKIHSATKVFQALRIFVNKEISELIHGMIHAAKILKKDGLLVIVTFHSLEDKIVKYFFRSLSEHKSVSRYHPEEIHEDILFKLYQKKPIVPSNLELKENPPSRSAKLRCLIKKENFYDFKTDILDKFKDLIEIENLGLNL